MRHARVSSVRSVACGLAAVATAAVLTPPLHGAAAGGDPPPDPEPRLWSDPGAWPDGTVPAAGTLVEIPGGVDLILDVSPPDLAGLDIQGTLCFAEIEGLELRSNWIRVSGPGAALRIGTPTTPHAARATITLLGPPSDASVFGAPPLESGMKFLMVMGGGTLDLHGTSRDKVAWTVLDAPVSPGDDSMTLAEPVNWAPGDQVVIAPSGFDPHDAEAVLVTAVSADGRTVSFGPWAERRHAGHVETHGGRDLDMRAEVGLLSRSIVLRGDAASESTSFGGHTMVMPGGVARISGVLFHRMGQMGRAARYPMHWHLVDRYSAGGASGSDSWIRDCSVRRSYQRAVVAHGTSGVTVERVVTYDVRNHAFIPAEEGDEEANRFASNLAVLTLPPPESGFAFPDPDVPGHSLQGEHRTSGFWLRNPNNILVDNRVAGTWNGAGFMYEGFDQDESEWPQPPPLTAVFRGNVAHTNDGDDNNEAHPYRKRVVGLGAMAFGITRWLHPGLLPFEDFTTYKNAGPGVWLETRNEAIRGVIVADSWSGLAITDATVADAVVVGRSDNDIDAVRHVGRESIGIAWRDFTGRDQELVDVHLDRLDVGLATNDDGFGFTPGVSAAGLSFGDDVGLRFSIRLDTGVTGSFFDRTGAIAGTGVPTLLSREPLGPSSFELAGGDRTWVTPIVDVDEPRIVITDPPTGAFAGRTVTLQVDNWNHVPAPGDGQERTRLEVNGEVDTLDHPGPYVIDGLVPGWNRIALIRIDENGDTGGPEQIRDRVNLFVPDGATCPADVDRDGVVGAQDLLFVLFRWEWTTVPFSDGDASGDGRVGLPDLLLVLQAFGETCGG